MAGRFKHTYQRWQTRLFRVPWFSRVFVETMGTLGRPIYEWTLTLLAEDLADAQRLCDVGCGNALMSRYVARDLAGRHFTLVDQSASQIEAGREVIKGIAAHNAVTSYALPVEEMPLEDDSIDVLYTTGSINLWTDPVAGLAHCKRVVRPGGVLWLFDQSPCVTPGLAMDALVVKRIFGLGIPGYTLDEVLEFAALAGLPRDPQVYPNMSIYGIRWQL
jgi:SAM-dependent methyltransferase